MGMTGFDSVILNYASLRSGMAAVPVTHLLHTITAKTVSERLGSVGRFASAVKSSFVPAFA